MVGSDVVPIERLSLFRGKFVCFPIEIVPNQAGMETRVTALFFLNSIQASQESLGNEQWISSQTALKSSKHSKSSSF